MNAPDSFAPDALLSQLVDAAPASGLAEQPVEALRIGSIRDCFSEVMFPGISASQTRAKYFVTVPRIFRDYGRLAKEARRNRKLPAYLRDQEARCMEALVRNQGDERENGIIGGRFSAKPREVLRRPSQVYWPGIRKYGLINTRRSLTEFLREFAAPEQPLLDIFGDADDPGAEDELIKTPPYQDRWIDSLTMDLSEQEASFLSRQIAEAVPNSLIGQVLSNVDLRQRFAGLPEQSTFVNFAEDPSLLDLLSDELRQIVQAASDFAMLIRGAQIRYCFLAQQQRPAGGRGAEHESLWSEWRESMSRFPWQRWNASWLRQLAGMAGRPMSARSIAFVEQWRKEVQTGPSGTERLDDLIVRRVAAYRPAVSDAVNLVSDSPSEGEMREGATGIAEMNFRWHVARTIIRDIHAGLSPARAG